MSDSSNAVFTETSSESAAPGTFHAVVLQAPEDTGQATVKDVKVCLNAYWDAHAAVDAAETAQRIIFWSYISAVIAVGLLGGAVFAYSIYDAYGPDYRVNMIIIAVVACLTTTLPLGFIVRAIVRQRVHRYYKRLVATEFADIRSPPVFIDTVIANPERARHWRWLQMQLAEYRCRNLYADVYEDIQKEAQIWRTCRSTELPSPGENVDAKVTRVISSMTSSMRSDNDLAVFVMRRTAYGTGTLKALLMGILPITTTRMLDPGWCFDSDTGESV